MSFTGAFQWVSLPPPQVVDPAPPPPVADSAPPPSADKDDDGEDVISIADHEAELNRADNKRMKHIKPKRVKKKQRNGGGALTYD